MAKLRLGAIEDGKLVKLTLELPPAVARDLASYAEAVGLETSQPAPDKARLATEMLSRFMATDRGFLRFRRGRSTSPKPS